MPRKTLSIGALLAAAALALPGAASAADTHEPNNGIQDAFGPVPANTAIPADFGSTSDVDWYFVRVSGQGTLTVNLNNLADSTGCKVIVELLDADGQEFVQIDATDGATNKIAHSTPGTTSYFVRASTYSYCATPGNSYRISVGGPVTGGAGVGTPTPTPNQSPTAATAFGPLTAGTLYGASRDAEGEQDWFMFYTAGPGAFDVAITNSGDAAGCTLFVRLRNEAGTEMIRIEVADNTIGHLRYTAPRAQKFLVQVEQPSYCSGATAYRLRADGPLTSTPAPALDTDGDGIADVSDKCPTKAGTGDGCQTASTTPTKPTTPTTPTPTTPVKPGTPQTPSTTPATCSATKVASLSKKLKTAKGQLKAARKVAGNRRVSKKLRRAAEQQVRSLTTTVATLDGKLRVARSAC